MSVFLVICHQTVLLLFVAVPPTPTVVPVLMVSLCLLAPDLDLVQLPAHLSVLPTLCVLLVNSWIKPLTNVHHALLLQTVLVQLVQPVLILSVMLVLVVMSFLMVSVFLSLFVMHLPIWMLSKTIVFHVVFLLTALFLPVALPRMLPVLSALTDMF